MRFSQSLFDKNFGNVKTKLSEILRNTKHGFVVLNTSVLNECVILYFLYIFFVGHYACIRYNERKIIR